MPRRRRSQKPIASQVHWRQRVDSATASSRRVRDLVLDVAVVAHLGLHRLQPVARLLDLARERHDREELGLRLGQRLAGPDGVQVEALEVGVDGVGRAAALGDRPATTVAAPIRTSPVPKTPGRPVSKVTASALRRRCLVASTPSEPGPIQVRSGPWPMASSTRSQAIDELGARAPAPGGAGRRRPARRAPSRMNSTPVTLPFSSVMTRTGPAWKMARDAFLDRLVDLVRTRACPSCRGGRRGSPPRRPGGSRSASSPSR